MAEFWGTALDGELAYRRDRMSTALRRPTRDARVVRPDGRLRPVRPTHPLISAARGWLLRGSGAWHVAR
ncbi:hypothetical protein ACPPVS_01555 [Cellulomonas sp. McL0617]|uniref:hypothetical protein n=1 Tax=Cellulomonas sp. McL0617 TaxID=3415675 RepID=UPI003CECC1E5